MGRELDERREPAMCRTQRSVPGLGEARASPSDENELRVCDERRGLGKCGRTVAVGDVGSCGALGSTSDTLGFCSESNEKPLEDFGQGHACSRVHFTRISPDLCGGEALGGRRETCGDELGHYGSRVTRKMDEAV